jgi:MYXO-CTERM domain-containing protein
MATLTVDVAGTGDFATIQEAIDAAVSGDTIEVLPGEYVEAIDFSGKDLEIVSASGSSSTSITGSVTVASGEGAGAKLVGFTITNASGTAVYVDAADPAFEDLVIEGSGTGAEQGGAMYVRDGSVDLSLVVMRGNVAAQGALYVTGGAKVATASCTFESNQAESGAAVYVDGGEVDLGAATVSGNYGSDGPGGAYVAVGARLTSTGSVWLSNRSLSAPGAMLHVRGEATLLSDLAQDNYAQLYASGSWAPIYADGGGVLELRDATLYQNIGYYGGAVGLVGASATIEETELTSNVAWYGGAIYASASSLVISDVTQLRSNEGYYSGGAVYASSSDVQVDSALFEGNTSAYGYGGALYAKGGTLSLVADMEGNYARDYGGGVRALQLEAPLEVSGSFGDNVTDGAGGAFYVTEADVRVSGASFAYNVAGGDGGAIAVETDASLSISDTTFEGNGSNRGYGGAVFVYPESTAHDLTVDACTFVDNTAVGGGGAVAAWVLGELVVEDSVFEGNVGYLGGAVSSQDAVSRTVSTTTFCGNSADAGGAWYSDAQQGTNLWNRVIFQHNRANDRGGALWMRNDDGAALTNVTFVGNEAAEGGAIWLYASSPDVVNTIFAYTPSGDGIYAQDALSYPTFGWSAFWDNDSDDVGGTLTPAVLGSSALFVDPGFVAYTDDGDCANDDLHLAAGSALVDAGAPAITDPDGSPSDVGAYGPYPSEPDTDEPDTDTGAPDTDTGSGDTDVGDTDTDTPGDTDVADTDDVVVVRGKGCSCSVPGAPPSGLGALLLLTVLARTRRQGGHGGPPHV